MAETIGDVAVRIGADTSGLTRGLASADKSLQGFGDKAQAVAAKVAALSAAAVVAAAGVGVLIKSQIDLADAAGDAAQKAGVSVEEWSRLSYAFKFGTKDGADLGQTLLFLNKAIAGAGAGVKGNVEDFRALGVAYKNSDGSMRSASAVLDDIADAFAKLPDGANKAAMATQFFGKSGADIIPFLNQGSAGIRQLKEEAERLGAVLSQEAADSAGQFNDNLERIRTSLAAAGMQLSNALLPQLASMSESLVGADGLVEDFKDSLDNVAKAAEVIAAVIAGRLVASVSRSAFTFAAAQAEALRYQMTLARMAGTSSVASSAMGGLLGAGRSLLGVLGGQVGLAVTVGALGLSLVDFSQDADVATMSAKDFDQQLANMAGNTDKLRESQQKLKLDNLMASMRAVTEEITRINTEAEQANAKLGLAETQRIQELQRRLAELGKAYQDVANQKVAAPPAPTPIDPMAPTQQEADKAAEQLAKKQAEWDRELEAFIQAEADKAAASDAADRARHAAEIARIEEQYKTEDQLLADKLAREQAAVAAAREAGVISKEQNDAMMLDSYVAYEASVERIRQDALARQKAMDDAALQAKLSGIQTALSSGSTLMNSESRKMFEVGKAAAIANSMISTFEGVAKAWALGPILGPPMAALVAASGFAQVANIRKQQFRGGGSGGSAGGGSVTGAINNANTPVSPTGNAPAQRTNITLVGDMFGREAVIGLLNEAFKDGYTISGA